MFASYEDGMSKSTAFQTTPDGQLPNKQTRKTYTLKVHSKTVIVSVFACKLKALENSRGSYPFADMETSGKPSIRYTASLSDRLAVINFELTITPNLDQ